MKWTRGTSICRSSPSACAANAAPPPPPPDPAACTDRVETRTVGDVKLGFPVKVTTTTTIRRRRQAGSHDLVAGRHRARDHAPRSSALFDVPAGYTEANSTAEIVPAVGNGGLADAVFGSTADGTQHRPRPKKAGIIRIGVLEPVNQTDRNLSGRFLRQDVVAKFNKAIVRRAAARGLVAGGDRAGGRAARVRLHPVDRHHRGEDVEAGRHRRRDEKGERRRRQQGQAGREARLQALRRGRDADAQAQRQGAGVDRRVWRRLGAASWPRLPGRCT